MVGTEVVKAMVVVEVGGDGGGWRWWVVVVIRWGKKMKGKNKIGFNFK